MHKNNWIIAILGQQYQTDGGGDLTPLENTNKLTLDRDSWKHNNNWNTNKKTLNMDEN